MTPWPEIVPACLREGYYGGQDGAAMLMQHQDLSPDRRLTGDWSLVPAATRTRLAGGGR